MRDVCMSDKSVEVCPTSQPLPPHIVSYTLDIPALDVSLTPAVTGISLMSRSLYRTIENIITSDLSIFYRFHKFLHFNILIICA